MEFSISVYLSDLMVKYYLWLWLACGAGWIAFGHLWKLKRGLPCYMAYLTLMMFSVWIIAHVNLYARYLVVFHGELGEFAFTPLWYARWMPFTITATVASFHVVYKNYFWDGYKGKNRRIDDRRGGIK